VSSAQPEETRFGPSRSTLTHESHRAQTLSRILNESDRLDPSTLREISEIMSNINKSVLSAESVFRIIEIVHASSLCLNYFGICDLQLWICDDSGQQILWSVRSDGHKVSCSDNIPEYLSLNIALENSFDAIVDVHATSRGWTTTKSIVTSLIASSEKLWGNWKSFRVLNIPRAANRAILIAGDSENHKPNLTTKSEVCQQHLQKLAMSISFRLQQLESADALDLANKTKIRAEAMLSLSSINNSLINASSFKDICLLIAQTGCKTLQFALSWCFLSFPSSYPGSAVDDPVVLMFRGHGSQQCALVQASSLRSQLFHPMGQSFDLQSIPSVDIADSSIYEDVKDGSFQYISSEICSDAGVKVVFLAALHKDKNLEMFMDPLKELFSMGCKAIARVSKLLVDQVKSSCLEIPCLLSQALNSRLTISASKPQVSKYMKSISDVVSSQTFSRCLGAERCHLLFSSEFFVEFSSDIANDTFLSVENEAGLYDSYNFYSESNSKNWLHEIRRYGNVLVYRDAINGLRAFGVDSQGRPTEIFEFASWLHKTLSNFIGQGNSIILISVPVLIPGRSQSALAVLLVTGRTNYEFDRFSSLLQLQLDLRTISTWRDIGLFQRFCDIFQSCLNLKLRDYEAIETALKMKSMSKSLKNWREKVAIKRTNHRLASILSAFDLYLTGSSVQTSLKSLALDVFSKFTVTISIENIEDFGSFASSMTRCATKLPIFMSTAEYSRETCLFGFLCTNNYSNNATGFIKISSKDSSVITDEEVILLQLVCEFCSQLNRVMRKESTITLLRSSLSTLLDVEKQESSDQTASFSRLLETISKYYSADVATLKIGKSKIDSSANIQPCEFVTSSASIVTLPVFTNPNLVTSEMLAVDGKVFAEFSLSGDLKFMDSTDDELSFLHTIIFLMYKALRFSQLSENYTIEKATSGSFKNKLSSSLALTILSTHIIESRNVDELSIVIRAKLPLVVGCKKTFLMLPDSVPNAYASTGPHESEERVILSIDDLENIPIYGSENFGKLSKIVIIHAVNKSVVGYILCYDPSQDGLTQWQGLHEILSGSLSSYVTSSMSKFDFFNTMAGVKQALLQLEKVQQENEQLKGFMDNQRAEIAASKKELGHITDINARTSSLYASLMDLINSFSTESGSHVSSITEWLMKITGSRNISGVAGASFIIKRESGVLTSDISSSRELIGAAMEAVEKKRCIEVKCHLLPESQLVSVLLLPNIYLSIDANTKYACFVIFQYGDKDFDEDDKIFFMHAVNMCCRSLSIAETSPFTLAEFNTLERKVISQQYLIDRFRGIVETSMRFNESKSLGHIQNVLMSEDLATVLRRTKDDICSFTVFAKLGTDLPYSDIGENQHWKGISATDNILILRALRSGEPFRQKNKLFYPVKLGSSPVLGIIIVERQFQPMSSDFVSEAPKIEELMINDDDEAAICSLARITALAIENLQRYNGATEGISQASSAIQALQKHIANLEDAAAIHVACRLQTEEARDKGLQLLTLSSSNQVNVSYLLEVIFILHST